MLFFSFSSFSAETAAKMKSDLSIDSKVMLQSELLIVAASFQLHEFYHHFFTATDMRQYLIVPFTTLNFALGWFLIFESQKLCFGGWARHGMMLYLWVDFFFLSCQIWQQQYKLKSVFAPKKQKALTKSVMSKYSLCLELVPTTQGFVFNTGDGSSQWTRLTSVCMWMKSTWNTLELDTFHWLTAAHHYMRCSKACDLSGSWLLNV